jgi:SAM-dependent methyltransferase
MRVLDLACGGGDVLLRQAQWAQGAGLSIEFIGWDRSPTAIDQANKAAQRLGLRHVGFEVHDVLADPIAHGEFAVIYSTLFFHHLADEEAEELLKKMSAAASHLVIVDDLLRTRLGYWLAWYGGRLLSRSKLVHVDGPLSVRAAFTMDELREMSDRLSLFGATLERHWPERCSLIWERASKS